MRETRANGCGALPTRRTVPGRAAAGRHCLARVRPGEEHLHATDGGGVSNASAIGVRGLCNRSACRMRCPPACDSSSSRGTGRATACPCRPLVPTHGGLEDRLRARSAARKTNHSHGLRTGRAMRRERRAADAPCGRFAFSKRSQRKTGARLSGRTLRPNDDAVPPMEDIEDGPLRPAGARAPAGGAARAGAAARRAAGIFVTVCVLLQY